jgi:hypothetical protein
MVKRIVMAMVAMVALAPLWPSEAEAQSCLQYRVIGGSAMCTAWSTKGVLLEITYKQDCGPQTSEGGGFACSVIADARSSNSIAFCADPTSPTGVSEVRCGDDVRFFGADSGCDPKHENDESGQGGKGHNKGKHGCKSQVLLQQVDRQACNDECAAAGFGPALDVTPITMNTNVAATVVPSDEGGVQPGPESSCQFGGVEGGPSSCTFTEFCSINPNRIDFMAIRPYQCTLTSAGGPPPPFPCESGCCEDCVN